MNFDKDSFRVVIYSGIVLVVAFVGLLAWYKGKK